MAMETSASVDNRSKKNQKKFPKRIHKAEKEKMKRDHLNKLFLSLANSLELSDHNNGKASILIEATRLLKDMFAQIESLKKESAELLSEAHYVTVEKNELKDENSALGVQIGELQTELNSRVCDSQLDLNQEPPPQGNNSGLLVFPDMQQGQKVNPLNFAALCSNIQAYPEFGNERHSSRHIPNVSKPHARYPTPADTWQSQILEKP